MMELKSVSTNSQATLLAPDNDVDYLVHRLQQTNKNGPTPGSKALPTSSSMSCILAENEPMDIDDMLAIPALIKVIPVKSKGWEKLTNFFILMDQERYR